MYHVTQLVEHDVSVVSVFDLFRSFLCHADLAPRSEGPQPHPPVIMASKGFYSRTDLLNAISRF